MATGPGLHNARQENADHTCPSKAFPVQKERQPSQGEKTMGMEEMLDRDDQLSVSAESALAPADPLLQTPSFP